MTHDQRAKMRARILEAARERFLEEGLDGLSMRGIASRVGVSSMTLYLYYESRQDIVRHITIDGFKTLNAAVDKAIEAAKPADKLKTLVASYVEWASKNNRWYSAMYGYLSDDLAVAPEDPLLAGPSNVVADHLKKLLIAAGHSEGAACKHSTFLWGTLHSIAVLQIGGQIKQRATTIEALTEHFLGLANAALAAPEAEAPKASSKAKAKK